MDNWYDKEEIYCVKCNHRWVLMSDKNITDEQHYNWIKKVKKLHKTKGKV